MPGETRRAVQVQPDWHRGLDVSQRLPDGADAVFTGCGTSFHAAQTGGRAVQALEAAHAFRGPVWLVTGKSDSTLVPTVHPVVDIVRFQLLTLAIA